MLKSELVERLAQRFSQLVFEDAEHAVKTIRDSMILALARGNRIEIRGFGSYCLYHRPPRVARNPKSGKKVLVPAKYAIYFRAGKELRKRIAPTIQR